MRCATHSGKGIGLISRVDAARRIFVGDLVAPLGVGVFRDMPPVKVPGFYLVLPRAHRRIGGIASFFDRVPGQSWLDNTG